MSSDQLITCISDKNNNRVKQTNCIENNLNMVVSLPINVVTSNQTVLVLNNHNLSTTPATPTLSSNVTTVTTQQQQDQIGTTNSTTSKYLLLDKNQIIGGDAESYVDIVNGIGNLQNGNENGGGGSIVVLATQQINTQNQNQTDEELTPLTWLHDKNLLKGINLSCTKMQSIPSSPQRHMSPTSDFLEDSCVSEENSSINSNSDNGVHSESNYYTNHKNVRNPGPNHHHSNESSTMSSSTSSSAPSSLSSPSSINSSPGAQTLIEYHTLSNSIIEDSSKMNNECSTSTIISPSSTLVPHQHFHKKYLREEHIRQLEHVGTTSSIGSNIITKTQYKHFINTPQGKYEIVEKEYPTTPSKLTPTYNRTISQEVTTSFSTSPRQPNDLNGQTILSTIHQHSNTLSPKHKSPNNMAYDPKIHTNNKPPYSFSSLIFMAIEDSPEKALPVKEIYAWIVQRFPYFKTAPTGWKNSVRHNLSLSKSFQKVEKAPNMGKGSLWRVDKHYRHNLVQTVSRSQMHPCATIEKTSMKSVPRPSTSPPLLHEIPNLIQNGHNGIVMQNGGQNGARALDAELFPRLSRYMAQMTTSNGTVVERPSPSSTPVDDDYTQNYRNADDYYHKISNGYATTNNNCNNIMANNNNNCTLFANRNFSPDRLARDFDTENIDDVNAAKAMLALKHGPKVFGENYHSPIITSSPSEDHTYSQGVNTANGVNNSGIELNNNNIIDTSIAVRLVDHQIHSDNNSNGTSSDAAYESSEEGHHHHHHRSDITPTKNNRNNNNNFYVKTINQNNINNNNNNSILSNAETEEQRRHAEGVDALLNLAGVTFTTPITLKRLSTTSLSDIQHQNNHSSNSNNNNNNSSNIIYQHSPSKKVKTKSVRNKLRKSFGEIK